MEERASGEPPRNLLLYVDFGKDADGRPAFAMVASDPAGNEVLRHCEAVSAKSSEDALYEAYFSMLEEALVLKGVGLQVHLGQPFAALDLDFDARRHDGAPTVQDYCTRIRELSGAFEGVNPTLLSRSEQNPATELLA